MTSPSGRLKVFISWSLPLSHKVALILRDWLPVVLQTADPWVSSEDIEKGTYWTEAIVSSLDSAIVGIIVVTPENHERTWLNFEAGVLARAIRSSGGSIMPLLINLGTTNMQGPMNTLQVTEFNKADIIKLLQAINARAVPSVSQQVLERQVEAFWPQLEADVKKAIADEAGPEAPPLKDREILEEILSGIRSMRRSPIIVPPLPGRRSYDRASMLAGEIFRELIDHGILVKENPIGAGLVPSGDPETISVAFYIIEALDRDKVKEVVPIIGRKLGLDAHWRGYDEPLNPGDILTIEVLW